MLSYSFFRISKSRRSLGVEVLSECSLSSEKMPPRKKMTREERLEKKRIAERLRYQRIKNDKDKYAQQKIKEREKYEKKKEKGVIKTVQQMTPREQRKVRKVWREKAKIRRRRLALQDISNAPETPPCSDSEYPPPPQNINRRAQAAQQKSIRARKARNLIIRKQEAEISQLKSAVQRYKKQIQRIKKPPISTPNTKVNSLITAGDKETIKKKLLFSEVITQQLNEHFSNLNTVQEKRVFRRVLSGKIVKKYNVLPKEMKIKPLSKIGKKLRLMDTKRSSRKNCENLKTCIVKFMEDDSSSRLCAGKKDFITKKGERKQKRVMLDTLLNLHKRFVEKTHIKISYPMFCKLRPFWVVQPRCDGRNTCMCVIHSNIDLMLKSLYNAKIISVSNYVDLLNQVCCNRFNEKCLSRECKTCLNKDDLAKALEKTCPNIKIFTVDDADISEKAAKLGSTEGIKTFSGTLKVHQVTGCVRIPNCLKLKSLSCFCDSELCRHFQLGTLDYPQTHRKFPLRVDDIYEASNSEDKPLINFTSQEHRKKPQKTLQHSLPTSIKTKIHKDDSKPSTSGKKTFCNGDFVLVKLQDKKTEYRYVAMCTGVEEDDELEVIFCKICDDTGKKFRINDDDISFIAWDQVLKKLPSPNLKMRGQRIFYTFNESIGVFERGF
ncbi:unnamed protein product [Arctia plantaginis]|uniref:Uncharacterized protein n=1 Tax=Arctia plantaginis TaxID=874455 RepID=A0A8S0Z8R0_ARCPL|nr:unnamed protein product [Arctia plantaginis]